MKISIKKILSLILALAAIACVFLPAFVVGASDEIFVFDEASILTRSERASLNEKAAQYLRDYGVRAIILTSNTVPEDEVEDYADAFVYSNYGSDAEAVMIFISFFDRDVVVLSYGDCARVFTNGVCDSIRRSVTGELSNGYYESAFSHFLDLCADHEKKHSENDDGFDPEIIGRIKSGAALITALIVGIGISLIIAFLVAGSMKKKLKTANAAHFAQDYVVGGSLRITSSRDTFLYSTTTRIPKPKSTSGGGHIGGGGGGHSVSHGKF